MGCWRHGRNGAARTDRLHDWMEGMKKEVTIELLGIQDREGEEERVETITEGNYFLRGDSHYVSYEEELEDIPQKVKTLLHIGGGMLSVTKRGAAQTKMEFIPGKKTMCSYQTPFGKIPMEIHTKRLEIIEEEDRLLASAEYYLESAGIRLSACKLEMCIASKKDC